VSSVDAGVNRIPIVSLDDPTYQHLARRVAFPDSDRARGGQFFPAHAGLTLPDNNVDVSFLYSFRREPTTGFDRHLRTEEMFVLLEGDLVIPLAPCRNPDDPDEVPTPDEFVAALVPQGEAIILRPNVWHNGGWPVDPERGVRYIMVLSGHRAGAGHQGRVDHVVQRFAGGAAITPDWSTLPR
jgi:hypothetical protein